MEGPQCTRSLAHWRERSEERLAAGPEDIGSVSGVLLRVVSFFFQAEDGIRDYKVTGVQTCALPISTSSRVTWTPGPQGGSSPNGHGPKRKGTSAELMTTAITMTMTAKQIPRYPPGDRKSVV